jgi:hypothetical protein
VAAATLSGRDYVFQLGDACRRPVRIARDQVVGRVVAVVAAAGAPVPGWGRRPRAPRPRRPPRRRGWRRYAALWRVAPRLAARPAPWLRRAGRVYWQVAAWLA